jgi:GT2 family glycosyltransferase
VILFVDSDVIVHPGTLSRVRRTFEGDVRLVALFGSYDDTVATSGTVAGFRNLLHHIVHQRSAGDVRSFWAGLGAVRRTAFEAAGGFDAERYPSPSIEDVELGGRLSREGRILLDPALLGTHLKEWSLARMVHTDFRRRGIPWTRLLVRERHLPSTLNLGARERLSVMAALGIGFGIVRRRPLLVAGGIGAEMALNHDLLAVLHRRLGLRGAVVGVGLHTVHQLTAVAAIPAALLPSRRS